MCWVLGKAFDDITLDFTLGRHFFTGEETGPDSGKRLPGVSGARLASPQPALAATTRQRHHGTRYFQEIPPRLGEAGHRQQAFGAPGTGMRALDVKGGSKAGPLPGGGQPWGDAAPATGLPASSQGGQSAPVSTAADPALAVAMLPAPHPPVTRSWWGIF